MILSFKHQFVLPILQGNKIHTIRKDPHNRWTPGKHIHFATGVRTSKYNCFYEAKCKSIQRIEIYPDIRKVYILRENVPVLDLTSQQIDQLADNDGFNSTKKFWEWFSKDFSGVLIHWTDHKYIQSLKK